MMIVKQPLVSGIKETNKREESIWDSPAQYCRTYETPEAEAVSGAQLAKYTGKAHRRQQAFTLQKQAQNLETTFCGFSS